MAQYCDFKKPYIMDWTVLPGKIAAKAWMDAAFLQDLLSKPTEVLRSRIRKSPLPEDVTFYVHEDTESVHHFPLPAVQDSMADMPREDLKQKVEEETGEETTFDYMLPAAVIFRSLVDSAYRARLLAEPDATLLEDGFASLGFRVVVHENTAAVHHLALPVNAWKDQPLGYDALVQKIYDRMLG